MLLALLFTVTPLPAQTARQKVDTLIELMQSGKWQEAETALGAIESEEFIKLK